MSDLIEQIEQTELNASQVDHEYGGSEIQVLEGLEAVRKRPGMYIGSTSESGLHHLVYEIVDNSIDEALAGFCNEITVSINEGDTITVTDNGRGIPVDIQPQTGLPALEVVFTVLHAGGKFGGGGYKVSGGLHGVGASVVNALSEWLVVQVHKNGQIYEMRFSRGAITQPMKIVGETDYTGTTVTFKPDPEMFDVTTFSYDTIHTRMQQQAFLNAGLKISTFDRREGRDDTDAMCYEGGIREYVAWLNQNKTPLHDGVIYMHGSKDDASVEIALQYNDNYNETIVSFANDVRTPEGGMHEEGFKRALTTVLNSYGKKNNIIKGDDKVSGEDCREGLMCVISVKLTEAQFEGQTKAKLGNASIRTLTAAVVSEKLDEYLEENPKVARMILDKAMMANRAREAAKKARESIRRKTALGGAAMPDKLRDCNENNPELTEIYIVEGDSAGGSATQGRDSRFQAILPLWGKMLNVEKARVDKVYGNDKLQPVITALGAGIGEDFDVNKLRYHKVIIMADADVDGSHIRTLLLTFFFRFMRPLIEQGYVYSAVPPLFKLSRGKTTRLAFSEEERDAISAELRGDNPNAKVDISRFKGLGEMNPHELWETTMDPEKRTLRRIELDDAVKADAIFTVLMGEKVEPRKEFIEKNAKYAVNLDY
ncbi:MAG: DNA topoisomerase (ATP-hydrolyzing) subunit B [Oscillospiraceae bacterium]|jgi:DNA gyrase subunit B|nr:DNA topoisomerase (ATP-hydrolyzing) subunit B [Oscillospiraceae bacterium]